MRQQSPLARDTLPLRGRSVLVTGSSRRAGIGYATACRLAAYGASVFCHHYTPHDQLQPWGDDDISAVLDGVREHLIDGAHVADLSSDLAADGAPRELVETAVAEIGPLDAVVCNQALSGSDGTLRELTSAQLDQHWAVNARTSILLAQAFAHQHRAGRHGSIVFLTSGQAMGPMPGEIAYAAAKAALAGVTLTLSDELADAGIRVNTVNPGPVDTGYLTSEAWQTVASKFPAGRFGQPDDAARLIAWLVTDEADWITGQVIDSEGGFARWRD